MALTEARTTFPSVRPRLRLRSTGSASSSARRRHAAIRQWQATRGGMSQSAQAQRHGFGYESRCSMARLALALLPAFRLSGLSSSTFAVLQTLCWSSTALSPTCLRWGISGLSLGHSPRPDLQSAQADPAVIFPDISLLALQRYYEIVALFIHAGLQLLCSQETLRELGITLDDQNSPTTARESLLTALESVTLLRLRHLIVVNRAKHLPLDFAPHLLAACTTVRTLELIPVRLASDAYHLLDGALLAPGLRVSTLVVSSRLCFATFGACICYEYWFRDVPLLLTISYACGLLVGSGAYRLPTNLTHKNAVRPARN